MKTKPFDAVEMTRRIRDRMYEETKDLGSEELLRYFQERGESARKKVQEREAAHGPGPSRISLR
jgi:hypothetical protein